MTIEARLEQLGLQLPQAASPLANYVPAVRTGHLLFISGHVSSMVDPPVLGKVGLSVSTEAANLAARAVCLALLGTARSFLGDLDAIRQVVKLTGMVNSAEGFSEQPRVIDGASDLLVDVFGDRGRHARAAFGVAGLPADATVEIDLVLEVSAVAGSGIPD